MSLYNFEIPSSFIIYVLKTHQVKDRVEYYISTPVTVNVRVTMNDTLRFPVLTLCNKNIFNMSQIRLLRAEMFGTQDVMTANQSDVERKLDAQQAAKQSPWNISQLVGFRGMDVKQLWDAIAHHPDKIIEEVRYHFSFKINILRIPVPRSRNFITFTITG